jgi:replicative DNA helicase
MAKLALDTAKPLEEVSQAVERQVFEVTQEAILGTQRSPIIQFADIAPQVFETIEERFQSKRLPGFESGLYDLDEMLNGWQRKQSYYILARPSMGKTAFAMQVGTHIASAENVPVLMFSLEMAVEQLFFREIAAESGVSGKDLQSGRFNGQSFPKIAEAMQKVMEGKNFFIDDSSSLTIDQIYSKIQKFKSEQGSLGVVIFDHIHLMRPHKDGLLPREAMAYITNRIRAIGKDFDVVTIPLCQLNRSVEDQNNKRPGMHNARESGSIEQDADIALGLYRDDYYNPDSPDRGIAEIIICKQRNGPRGTVKTLFDGQTMTFKNLESRRYS